MPLPPSLANCPTLGPGDEIGSGASIVHDLLPPEEAERLFDDILTNTPWHTMTNHQSLVPRLVCEQGLFHDALRPIYRHPSDMKVPQHRMLPSILHLAKVTQERLGLDYPFNHALVQLYRTGAEFISEHADKTIDMVDRTVVVNVSLGAQRTMRLRRKARSGGEANSPDGVGKRDTQRIHLPHNSVFVLDRETNREWLHGIMADKRRDEEKSEAERGFDGVRISVTLRFIGTFISGGKVVGQGARDPSAAETECASTALLHAFSLENKSALPSSEIYTGSDVVDLVPDEGLDKNKAMVWVPPIFGNDADDANSLDSSEVKKLSEMATVNPPVKIPGRRRGTGMYRVLKGERDASGIDALRQFIQTGDFSSHTETEQEKEMQARVQNALAASWQKINP